MKVTGGFQTLESRSLMRAPPFLPIARTHASSSIFPTPSFLHQDAAHRRQRSKQKIAPALGEKKLRPVRQGLWSLDSGIRNFYDVLALMHHDLRHPKRETPCRHTLFHALVRTHRKRCIEGTTISSSCAKFFELQIPLIIQDDRSLHEACGFPVPSMLFTPFRSGTAHVVGLRPVLPERSSPESGRNIQGDRA